MGIALEVIVIVLVGWVAGAELGSWCYVQPVVARLPYEHYVGAERAMLRTFGRIMAILMLLWSASRSHVTTLVVNVPINKRTAEWRIDAGSRCVGADADAVASLSRDTRRPLFRFLRSACHRCRYRVAARRFRQTL
jgi:hypothetical protein